MTSELEKIAKGIRDVSTQSGPVREPVRQAAAVSRRLAGRVPPGAPSSGRIITSLERADNALQQAEKTLESFAQRSEAFSARLVSTEGAASRHDPSAARSAGPAKRGARGSNFLDFTKSVANALVVPEVAEQWVPEFLGAVSDYAFPGTGDAVELATAYWIQNFEVNKTWSRAYLIRIVNWFSEWNKKGSQK